MKYCAGEDIRGKELPMPPATRVPAARSGVEGEFAGRRGEAAGQKGRSVRFQGPGPWSRDRRLLEPAVGRLVRMTRRRPWGLGRLRNLQFLRRRKEENSALLNTLKRLLPNRAAGDRAGNAQGGSALLLPSLDVPRECADEFIGDF